LADIEHDVEDQRPGRGHFRDKGGIHKPNRPSAVDTVTTPEARGRDWDFFGWPTVPLYVVDIVHDVGRARNSPVKHQTAQTRNRS
jgi:hypothetical protein